MDGLISDPQPGQDRSTHRHHEVGMPCERPLAMPEQSLRHAPAPIRRSRPVRPLVLRRLAAFGGAAGLTVFACSQMAKVLSVGDFTVLKAVVLALFTVNFAWIALTFVNAVIGWLVMTVRRQGLSRPAQPLSGRTAVVMPTYNEQPDRVFAAIEAMARGVEGLGASRSFDWFILSDTTDADVALAEQAALVEIRRRLAGVASVYYRRRRQNTARKAGNIADFCRRWGGAYAYMLVLDADSLLSGETIVELARRIDTDPDAGIVQTVPRLVNGRTVLARLQQFAGRFYGPLITTGLGWWAGTEGNYWGHNAILRMVAFAQAAGLPTLPGKAPFGGHIMSHDFVEAALIRRAGWSVLVAHDLDGSYEEGPPSIVDLAIRDRRWCQGNLQHGKVVGAKGLHWVSRLHLATGIMSYISSPLWLALMLAGLALSLQADIASYDYFGDTPRQLFPNWPRIDAQGALVLFALTMGVLLGPKLLAFVSVSTSRTLRRRSGGMTRFCVSFATEVVLSALIAPMQMLIQSGVIGAILLGRDAGWKPQRREDGRLGFRDLLRRHRWHMLVGLALTLCGVFDSLVALAWLSPAVVGLLFALPLSAATASPKLGAACRSAGVLTTPEETVEPAICRSAREARAVYVDIVSATPDLARIVADERLRRAHVLLADAPMQRVRGRIDPVEAVAAAKIGEASSVSEALSFLTPEDRWAVLGAPVLLERLAALPA